PILVRQVLGYGWTRHRQFVRQLLKKCAKLIGHLSPPVKLALELQILLLERGQLVPFQLHRESALRRFHRPVHERGEILPVLDRLRNFLARGRWARFERTVLAQRSLYDLEVAAVLKRDFLAREPSAQVRVVGDDALPHVLREGVVLPVDGKRVGLAIEKEI